MGNRMLTKMRLAQWGKESTPGTLVAATHQTVHPVTLTPAHEVLRPDAFKGYTMASQGDDFITSRATQVAIGEHPMSYAEIHRILGMSIMSGETPTASGNENTWLFERAGTGAFAPDTFTIQAKWSDGSTHYARRCGMMFMTDWRISAQAKGATMLSANGWAQAHEATAVANTITDLSAGYPRAVLHNQASRTLIGYHDTYASLGSAASLASELIGYSLEFRSGFSPLWTLSENSALDYEYVQFDPAQAGFVFDLTVLAKSGSADFFLDQQARADESGLQTAQAFRITHTGSTIDTNPRKVQIDLWGKSEAGAFFPGTTQDGQDTVTIRYVATPPASASDEWISATVVNADTASTY